MITIVEEWLVVDRWWTTEPYRVYYREVIWNGHILVFKRIFPQTVWRIASGERI